MIRTTEPAPASTAGIQGRYRPYALSLAAAVLLLFHAVGFWGLVFSGEPVAFQQLTPLNLLLTNVLLFSFHRGWSGRFLLFAAVVFMAGFVAEAVGVHTGLLFGAYRYGEALGPKLWQVPLLIGLNWLMLVYGTGHISQYIRLPWWGKAIVGAVLMVLLDYFIEPVAMRYDFWSWQGDVVPLSNYFGWFAVAFLLQVYCQRAGVCGHNRLAPVVYGVQLLFFISLYALL